MALTQVDLEVLQRMFDGLENRLDSKFDKRLDERFDAQERKFDARLDARFTAQEAKFNVRLDKQEATFDVRFDKQEAKFNVRFDKQESQFDSRLETIFKAFKIEIVDEITEVMNEALTLAGFRIDNVERRVTTLEAWKESR